MRKALISSQGGIAPFPPQLYRLITFIGIRMSKKLTVGGEVFEYPTTGDYNWGEESTEWAEAVTEIINTLSGPEDISVTEATLSNNSSGVVSGLSFNAGLVQQISVQLVCTRTFTDATPTRTEAFILNGSFNGSVFSISSESCGDECDIVFDIDNTGQITYAAANVANTDTIIVKFKGSAITQNI